MKVLLCDTELLWAERLAAYMKTYGIEMKIVRELEELWMPADEMQGVLVNWQELESMLFWGKPVKDKAVSFVLYSSVIRSLCLQGKKIVLVLPEPDYEAECICLQAGAAECIHKEQPWELMAQRILMAFQEEMNRMAVQYGGVELDVQTGRLTDRKRTVSLTPMEKHAMTFLFDRGTMLTTKEEIMLELWGEQTDAARVRWDTLLKQLRGKLRGFPIGIYTCYGKGYYLESGLIGGN